MINELFCFFEIEKVDLFKGLDPLEVVGQRTLFFDIHEQGVVGLKAIIFDKVAVVARSDVDA